MRDWKTLRKKDGRVEESYDEYTPEKTAVIERAYLVGERLGFQVWCEDEAGPYQIIPQPGGSWQIENRPARQAYQYLRRETAKLLTLFRSATGELRAETVQQSTNVILHPWLQRELTAILKQCPPARSGSHWSAMARLGHLPSSRAPRSLFPSGQNPVDLGQSGWT